MPSFDPNGSHHSEVPFKIGLQCYLEWGKSSQRKRITRAHALALMLLCVYELLLTPNFFTRDPFTTLKVVTSNLEDIDKVVNRLLTTDYSTVQMLLDMILSIFMISMQKATLH